METTGKIIKERRKELGISADEIADKLGVSRSTVFRYENGFIEKVPANLLEALAKVLHTTPAYLMGWSEDPSETGDAGADSFGNSHFSTDSFGTGSSDLRILGYFGRLNAVGKREAAKRVEELTHIERYTRPDTETDMDGAHLLPNAARARTDIEVTREMILHDEAIMDDEDF